MGMLSGAKFVLDYIISLAVMTKMTEGEYQHVGQINPGAPTRSKGKGKITYGVDPSSFACRRDQYARKSDQPHHCGQEYPEGVARCCAAHYRQWQDRNPGNGRYVKEKWLEVPNLELWAELGRKTYQRVWMILGGPVEYMIKKDGLYEDYSLLKWTKGDDKIDSSFQLVGDKLFDCLIDAQRAAARHLRLAIPQPAG